MIIARRLILLLSITLFLVPVLTFAQVTAIKAGLDSSAKAAGISTPSCQGTDCVTRIAGNVINMVLGFTGILLLGLFLYGGFLWMISQGEKDKVQKAMGTLRSAVAGLVIIGASYALTSYVLTQLGNAITNSSGTGTQQEETTTRTTETVTAGPPCTAPGVPAGCTPSPCTAGQSPTINGCRALPCDSRVPSITPPACIAGTITIGGRTNCTCNMMDRSSTPLLVALPAVSIHVTDYRADCELECRRHCNETLGLRFTVYSSLNSISCTTPTPTL